MSREELGRLVLRPARPEDVEELAHLDRHCFGHYSYPPRLIATFVSMGQFCPVAEVPGTGEVAGFAIMMAEFMRNTGVLVTLDVAEGWRRRGLGSALVGLCARELHQELPRASLWLTVASRNEGALAFYDALGFARTGEIPGYYRDDDALLMVHQDVEGLTDLASGASWSGTSP